MMQKLFLIAVISLGMINLSFGADLLEEAYRDSKSLDTVINLGNSKQGVGNVFFGGGITIGLTGIDSKDPLIVRITQFLLRMLFVIGVTMFIYSGFKMVLGSTEEKALEEQKTNAKYIVMGIILALLSVSIIYLLTSLTKSSINL